MIWLRNTFISIATISFRFELSWSICSIFRFRLLAFGVWLSQTILLESSIEQITKSEWAHFHRERACDLVLFSHGLFKSYCSSAHFQLSLFLSFVLSTENGFLLIFFCLCYRLVFILYSFILISNQIEFYSFTIRQQTFRFVYQFATQTQTFNESKNC